MATVKAFGEQLVRARAGNRDALGKLIAADADTMAQWFVKQPGAFADVLARAAQDLASGGMSVEERTDLARTFSRHSALLARLLSGMGA